MALSRTRPQWLTFDCYGTLMQWDEELLRVVRQITARHGERSVDTRRFLAVFDTHEHTLKQARPHRSFRHIAGSALKLTLADFDLPCAEADMALLTSSIASMPPFPEVVPALVALKELGLRLCIISNTDDDIIAGNVAQLGGTIDHVVTAEQAHAYKPSPVIFEYAYSALGVTKDDVVHICASPQLDLTAARDMGFRCI